MNNIVREINRHAIELEEMLRQMEQFMENTPEGWLKCETRGKKTYYYHCHGDGKGKKQRKYIRRNEQKRAQTLAQKGYVLDLKRETEKELNVCRRFLRSFGQIKRNDVYRSLSNPRKGLVIPMKGTLEEKTQSWEKEVTEPVEFHAENLRFETEQGEFVRSKSELILANMFYRYRDEIWYKYERPLHLKDHNRDITIYPDFTLFHRATGKLLYWEHAGRMDDPEYADHFVRKMNLYLANHIFPGEQLIFSYESLGNPLNIHLAKKMLLNLLGRED